ncbi:MAG: sodium/solute symporter [Opitutales bacterium]
MATGLQAVDWVVVVGYLAGLIALSAWLARGQTSGRDYYLGGNRTGPLPLALSTMATQCSTNSILGATAFVALAESGGLVWLQYELAVPLAMVVIMVLLMPIFRGLSLISVYDYLERRYGLKTRLVLSLMFQVLRAFSTGVTIFGVGVVLEATFGLALWQSVVALAVVTIVYDVLGGMRAVIWSDVIQLFVLLGAVLVAAWLMVDLNGGLAETWRLLGTSAEGWRLQTVDFAGHGLGDGQSFAFWPMLIGGLFLYVAYYGCDQTQAQRGLSARSVREANQALFLGGLLRFPFVLTYCLVGVALGAYVVGHPEFLEKLPLGTDGKPQANAALPVFVLEHFPPGLVGLVVVGLFAAAMSSLDSTINSLSALSLEDLVGRLRREPLGERATFLLGKVLTLFWGVVCAVFAFFVGDIAETIIESVNKIGSLINGPLLALFVMGMLTHKANEAGMLAGLIAGFGTNLVLWLEVPEISWLWWNVIGFGVCAGVGYLLSWILASARAVDAAVLAVGHFRERGAGTPVWAYLALLGFAGVILAVLLGLQLLAD